MARSKSSGRWLREHFQDAYVQRAAKEGYRSRASYKLLEIQEKDRILRRGMRVLDLGAAPGGWTQVAAPIIGAQGRIVALVSGGDPGIYAMAGLVFEMAREQNVCVDIEVIAGIAALNACAARLGAPLMHDFAAISLSDLLTPWEKIEKRLEAASSADFVVVIYNPKSKKRAEHIVKAREILLAHRAPETPVGIVTAATRENERIVLTTLGKMLENEIDMQTTIIVGNSVTFAWQGFMVTPRGYAAKYAL